MTETKAKTVNLTIISMGGRYATTGVNVAAGSRGKLRAGQVVSVPADVARSLEGCEALMVTKEEATHTLVGDEVVSA